MAFQRALREYVLSVDDAFGKQFEEFNVGFEGSFGSKHVTPRSLSAHLLGSLVCVEGIITKSESHPHTLTPSHPHTPTTGSVVRPKVVKSVHYCPATGKTIERKYSDLTSLEPFPTTASYPTKVRGRPHPLHPPQWCPIGRGWQFAGDRIWPVSVQGSPDPQYPGNPRESSGGAAASSSGRHS